MNSKQLHRTAKNAKALLLLIASLFTISLAHAADTLKVLFIGNSYTTVNNLPQMLANLAAAGGDRLIHQTSAPGGHTFQAHCSNTTTLSLIAQGGWDYVVLQEQSQLPAAPDGQVASQVYPYAKRLDSLVHQYTPCAQTVFYLTWGYKSGDAGNCAAWPPMCTYQGMDSLLYKRYSIMAEEHDAWISPAGRIRRRLRALNPGIELYDTDGSHPTLAGTYAAALGFYSLLYRKDPAGSTFNPGLAAADVTAIKTAAKVVAFDSLVYWSRFDPLPVVAFTQSVIGSTVQTTNTSTGATAYRWTFGDGSPAVTQTSPSHTYASNGNYNLCLEAIDGCDTVKLCRQVQIGTVGIADRGILTGVQLYPNPVENTLNLSGIKTICDYALYSSVGTQVLKGSLSRDGAISLDGLPAGLYYLQLVATGGQGSAVYPVKKR